MQVRQLKLVCSCRFDIRAPDFVGSVELGRDEEGMLESAQYINNLIEEEIRTGIPSHRIFLGGFSQGATMSLFVGLTTSKLLGGIICLSGRLILRDRILQVSGRRPLDASIEIENFQMRPHSRAREIPIFWGHGTNDPTLKYAVARSHANLLVRFLGIREIPEEGINGSLVGLIFLTYYGLGHTTCDSELNSLREWLKKLIPSA